MRADQFPTTRWSLVDRFGQTGSESQMAEFLGRYRPALVAFLTSQPGFGASDVEDLVQGFIADKLLQERLLRDADARRGKLRNFLMRSLHNYALNARRAAQTARRRPVQGLVSLESAGADPAALDSAQARFEVEWARAVLAEAMRRTEAEANNKSMPECWAVLLARVIKPLTRQTPAPSYAQLVDELGFDSPAEASNRLITAKRMFSRNLRAIISEYVSSPDQIEEELIDLQHALSRSAGAGPTD
ncbi:MAG: hypothetical protein GVY24_06315 [Planctomycetes bacterium]|jgi:DNA-directed RNA polymerase specialized sigma24 family protein|nr:hypothetical protein [Planctomycetota bacterium]